MAPCRGVSVQATRPLADVQALLPAGFTVVPAPFDATGNTAVVGVDLYACGNLTTPAAYVPDTYYGQAYTYVARPAERVPNAPEAAAQEYVFRVLANTDVLATLWPAAGYDTYNGTASVSVSAPADLPVDLGQRLGQGKVGSAAAAGDGYLLTAQGDQNPLATVANTASFARYTVLGDNSVLVWTGRYDFPSAYGGQGALQVDGGDKFYKFQQPGPGLVGLSRLAESGGMVEMDLRRVFTP
jgi:hypothetical protein